MWQAGNKVIRPYSPESGVGVIVGIEERFLDVFFPDTMERLKLSPEPESLRVIKLHMGMLVRTPTNQVEQIMELREGMARLSSGEEIEEEKLWPVIASSGVVDRLLDGEFDDIEHVLNRMDGLRLLSMQHTGHIPSLLGGRIELFPHQLDAAQQAISKPRVRWLLADEVGLGKTIVAHMITSAMLRMKRIERAVIVAPESLVLQWLGELYKKFHQVFVYIDAERIQHVATDFGEDVNPFDVHPLAIMSYEFLEKNPQWAIAMQNSDPQMMICDEAHQLLRPTLKEQLTPLIRETEHALLLTATPFQLGEEGFTHLVDTLGLEHRTLGDGSHLVKQVSAVTRRDIKKLPQRVAHAVEVDGSNISAKISENDPRVQWLIEQIGTWKKEKQRALIFVNDASRATKLTELLSHKSFNTLFCFHEQMDTQERDIELARFRLSSSPAMITSGAGSEGRNFQFCDVLVHFDLPEDPTILEQRIGRLDRIGRTGDLPIYYFTAKDQPTSLAKLYEGLGIFASASVGSSPAMNAVRIAIESGAAIQDADTQAALIEDTIKQLEHHDTMWNFPNSHQIEEGPVIMAQVPRELESLMERFCTDAAQRVGLDLVEKEEEATYSFEYGSRVVVDAIPGLAPEAHYLGTFSREEAVRAQEIDFFSNGHTIVEGLLAELEDSTTGAVGALRLKATQWETYAPRDWNAPGLYVLLHEGSAAHNEQTHKLLGVAGEYQNQEIHLEPKELRCLLESADHARTIGRDYAKQIVHAFEATDFDERVGAHGDVRFALVLLVVP